MLTDSLGLVGDLMLADGTLAFGGHCASRLPHYFNSTLPIRSLIKLPR